MKDESVKCPDCGQKNPADVIYCVKCETRLARRQPIQEPSSQPSEEPSPPEETIEDSFKGLTTGSIFAGQYQIIEELGEGGMGRVYKALDTKTDEEVALKVFRPEIAPDDKAFRRFRKEFKTARKISHKNVCPMSHLGTSKGIRYVTMEYVSGEDLKSSMKRMGQFTLGKAIFTAKQICEGLAEGHRLDVVHRNLKPQNIVINQFGNVRIMDFGIARSPKAEEITETGMKVGTPEYMSPEQVEGQEIDQRSDIYSVGLILYEMLAGRLPFTGKRPLILAMKHMDEALKGPREFNPQIPRDLNHLILTCLEREKEKRFQSAEELLSELIKMDTGIPGVEKEVLEPKVIVTKKVTAKFNFQKYLIPGLIIAAVAIVAILAWQFFLTQRSGSIPEGKPLLAIMYFENITGEESLEHWGEVIAESLRADLNQSKYIDVMSSERLFQVLNDLNQLRTRTYSSDVLKQVAARGEINHILLGNYGMDGDTIRIHITLMDTRREKVLASESGEGRGEESIFTIVDGLTKKIKRRLKLTADERADDFDREVRQITTKSLDAFKYYIDGRKYHLTGEYRQSIESMEKAISIDPEFAMAYLSMSESCGYLDLSPQRETYFQKTLELKDRLSEKEFYLVQGDYYRESEETYDKAIEAYTKLLELYPKDASGNQNLGTIYLDIEEFDKALEHFERFRNDKMEFVGTYFSIADVHMMKGLYSEAEKVLRFYLDNISDHSEIHHYLAFNYICQKMNHFALNELDFAFALDPKHHRCLYLRGVHDSLTGAFVEAEKEYRKLLDEREPSGPYLGLHGLANLSLTQGRYRESREHLRRIIEISQSSGIQWAESQARSMLALSLMRSKRFQEAVRECNRALDIGVQFMRGDLQRLALHYKGLAYVSLKSLSRAQRTADELKSLIEKGSHRMETRRYHHLMGLIELERKNYVQAIEHLETALSLLPFQSSLWTDAHLRNTHALFIDALALAYYRAGNLEKAQEMFSTISDLSTGRLYFGDIYARSFYILGRIFQRLGENEKAEENYNKFLALWLNADPDISEVNDAKRRLLDFNREP
ncbi:MAG: protein kinase [Candidatus Aminicenantes bacterium]|nr:protein kinase [Candidatus Aminicenantes bacterium]MDH5383404.1 protein kinase [Candidatus Aminicenantes bacterium]